MRSLDDVNIAVVGLGYVGLPLAVEFGKRYPTIGFDVKAERVAELERGYDSTLEATAEELGSGARPSYTNDAVGLDLASEPVHGSYDAIVIAHDEIRKLGAEGIHAFGRDPHVVYDIKHLLSKDEVDGRL